MDRTLNPFSPGSGRRPPELVGRTSELEAFDTVVARAGNRLGDRGIVLTGLRGVGKTVLLNEMRSHAERHDWLTVRLEARRDEHGVTAVRRSLAREVVTAARKLTRRKKRAGVANALRTITSFNLKIGATGISLGVEANPGRADSGDPEVDLIELVEDISEAQVEEGQGFAIFVDEMQDLDEASLGSLIAAQHLANQRDWPFYVIGAGLPNLPRVLTDARSYAERLFNYRRVGPLSRPESSQALSEPVERLGASFAPSGLDILLDAAGGYPYFIQEYGQAIWNLAPEKVFTADDALAAVEVGRDHLDTGFYRSRWERATPSERRFLHAVALDEDRPSASGEVAARLSMKITSLGPYRANLIEKGLIFSPEHGQIAFTVPGMSGYISRHHEE